MHSTTVSVWVLIYALVCQQRLHLGLRRVCETGVDKMWSILTNVINFSEKFSNLSRTQARYESCTERYKPQMYLMHAILPVHHLPITI
jgi:hypothetical protein